MEAACSNSDLIVFFVTSQALATWAIESGIKWPKLPNSFYCWSAPERSDRLPSGGV